ncbi:MAG: tetratricopeptide repeat protein [Ignavibacteriota bacterium]
MPRAGFRRWPRTSWEKSNWPGACCNSSRGRDSDAENRFRRALAAVEGSQSLIESYTLSDLGLVDLRRFRYDEALYWFERASVLSRRSQMPPPLEIALINLGATYMNLGDFERAVKNLNDALALAEQQHERVYQMPALVLLGETWSLAGDLAKAAECYQKARGLGDPRSDKEWLSNVLDDCRR